jgi:hypothetical protein
MATKPKPADDEPIKKEYIDILGMELEQNLPNWLSPAGKGETTDKPPKAELSEDRKQQIRDKHRARHRAEQKKKHWAKTHTQAEQTLARLRDK